MHSIKSQKILDIRKKRLLSVLSEKEASALAILKHEDIFYLTGFYGKESDTILIITPKITYLLVNFIFYEEAVSCTTGGNIEVVLCKGDRLRKVAWIISSLNLDILSVEASKINHSDFVGLSKELKKLKKKLLIQKDIIGQLRRVKDDEEIRSISKACRITDRAFIEVTNYSSIKISRMNELSLANEMEGVCIKNGGYGRSFDFIIASGSSSSKPHYISSHKKISGEPLLMDFGTVYKNYFSDITRTIFLKKNSIKKKLLDLYKIVLEAQQRAIDVCKEGIRCDELDNIARKHIEEAGYGKNFGHGLGHGVGLEVHEEPYITKKNKTELKENMVITIEPGVYVPGLGGIRIEDMVIVRKNSCRNLFKSKKDFTFLV